MASLSALILVVFAVLSPDPATTLTNKATDTYVPVPNLPPGRLKYLSNGLQFISTPTGVFMTNTAKSKYEMINLDGMEVSFDVDLSHVPCGYFLALYFVSMPSSAKPSEGYCDAQGKEAAPCSEMDVMEADNLAVQFTAHPCWGPPWTCNKTGTATKTVLKSIGIDSTKPFTINSHYTGTVMRQRFSQNGKSLHSVQLPYEPKLPNLVSAFHNGMVLAMSLFTRDKLLGIGGVCKTLPDKSTVSATITNIQIYPYM